MHRHWNHYKSGQNHLTDFIGVEPSKKRKRRTSFTPQALELLNAHFERNTHPSGMCLCLISSFWLCWSSKMNVPDGLLFQKYSEWSQYPRITETTKENVQCAFRCPAERLMSNFLIKITPTTNTQVHQFKFFSGHFVCVCVSMHLKIVYLMCSEHKTVVDFNYLTLDLVRVCVSLFSYNI